LDENIEHDTVLIDCSPEKMHDSVDLKEDLIEMPFVDGSIPPSSQTGGTMFTEFVAPSPDSLIAK
jgi:hypothetical protein